MGYYMNFCTRIMIIVTKRRLESVIELSDIEKEKSSNIIAVALKLLQLKEDSS